MITIYKQKLTLGLHEYKFPIGSKFLTVRMQHENPFVWFECDNSLPLEGRTILGAGTGHELPEGWDLKYIGTVQESMFVWHFFEATP